MTEEYVPFQHQSAAEARRDRGGDWMAGGIDTGSGRLESGAALAQMVTLPLLILLWAVGMGVAWALM